MFKSLVRNVVHSRVFGVAWACFIVIVIVMAIAGAIQSAGQTAANVACVTTSQISTQC